MPAVTSFACSGNIILNPKRLFEYDAMYVTLSSRRRSLAEGYNFETISDRTSGGGANNGRKISRSRNIYVTKIDRVQYTYVCAYVLEIQCASSAYNIMSYTYI